MIHRPLAALAVIVSALVLVLGSGGPAAAVAHGSTVAAGRYGFSARLTMTGIPTAGGGTRDSWCSGALVAPRWVITAGHCFRDENDAHVERPVARVTTVTFGVPGVSAVVVAVRQSSSHDVALAELDRAIEGVTPLPVSRAEPREGETLRLTGYGLIDDDGTVPARLQTGVFEVTAIGGGTIAMSGRSPRRDTSACLHDSGGPYFRDPARGAPELAAVVSEGPPCPHAGADQAARTDDIASWVSGTIGGSSPHRWWPGAVILAAILVVVLIAVLVGRGRRRASSRDPLAGPRVSVPVQGADGLALLP